MNGDLSSYRNDGTNLLFRRSLAVEFPFSILLVLLLAGTRPFQTGDLQALGQLAGAGGRGTVMEAALFLVPAAATMGFGFLVLPANAGHKAIVAFLPLWLLLGFAAMSLVWSDTPASAVPRFGLYALVCVSVVIAGLSIEPRRLIFLAALSSLAVVFVDLLSVAVVDEAVHGAREATEKLRGAWKGVHIHKNHAGPAAVLALFIAALLFVFERRWLALPTVLAALILLVGTRSMTSMLATLAAASALAFMSLRGPRRSPTLYLALLAVTGVAAALLGTVYGTAIVSSLVGNPALRARLGLWAALGDYVRAHPLGGAGFGSFWRVGADSPILRLADGWSRFTGQGHNGYIDAAVALGIPGLILTVATFMVMPGWLLFLHRRRMDLEYAAAFSFIAFGLIHNLTESTFLSGRSPVPGFMLLGSCMLLARTRLGNPRPAFTNANGVPA